MSFGITRRRFLEISGALSVGGPLLWGCSGAEPTPNDGGQRVAFAPEALTEQPETFPLGVQAGGMHPDSALLWTYTSSDQALTLIVWRESEVPGEIFLVKELPVTPQDGYAKVMVSGLGPGHYRYTFAANYDRSTKTGQRSLIGSFRTAFATNDARPLRLAAMTCTSLRNRPYVALDHIPALSPDVLLHLGDMSYNDGAVTLEDYRAKWRQTLSEPEYQRALSTAGLYMTWDDHEIGNDFNPERMAAEAPEQLAAAKQAFFETLAIERGPEDQLWRSYRWGKTAEIFVLDARSERLPSTRSGEQPIYLGEAQLAWLKQGLVQSEARFKLVLNSVPMTEMAEIWNFAAYDRWQGYLQQRSALVEHMINEQVEDVIFLSGDFHCGFVGRLDRRGPGRRFWEVAVGPTGNGPNPLPALAETDTLPPDEIFPADQFPYYSSSDKAMTLLELDPDRPSARVRFLDAREGRFGDVLYDADLMALKET